MSSLRNYQKGYLPQPYIDHYIDLILGMTHVSIPPYQFSLIEENTIVSQLIDVVMWGVHRRNLVKLGLLKMLIDKSKV